MNDLVPEPANGGDEHLQRPRNSATKRWVIVLVLCYSTLAGFLLPFLPDDQRLGALLGLPVTMLGLRWALADADERNLRIGRLNRIAIVLIFVVGFPAYLFRSRGIRGLGSVFVTLFVACGAYVCLELGEIAMLSLGDRLGYWEYIEVR